MCHILFCKLRQDRQEWVSIYSTSLLQLDVMWLGIFLLSKQTLGNTQANSILEYYKNVKCKIFKAKTKVDLMALESKADICCYICQ